MTPVFRKYNCVRRERIMPNRSLRKEIQTHMFMYNTVRTLFTTANHL